MKYSWLVLFMLICCYVMNQWDRFLINYLYAVPIEKCPTGNGSTCDSSGASSEALTFSLQAVCASMPPSGVNAACASEYQAWPSCAECTNCLVSQPDTKKFSVKYDTCLDSKQYGITAGYGFVGTFAVASLVAGRCTDLFNRKLLIGVAVMLWSVCTLAFGFSNNFAAIMGSRLGLGLFQAFLIPPCYSLIAAYFPKDMLGSANGIFNFGIYVGGALGSLSTVVALAVGWRTTAYICAGIGALVSVAFLLVVREPSREGVGANSKDNGEAGDTKQLSEPRESVQDAAPGAADPEQLTTLEALSAVFSDKAVVLLILAGGLRFFGGIGIGSFMPTFYLKKFNKQQEYALINAAVVSVGGALSSYLGGAIADRWSKRNVKARAWVPAIGSILGFIPFIGTLYFENFYVSLVCYFFEYLFAECWFGPAISIIQVRIPAGARGIAISLFLFTAQMVGNSAPTVYGGVWDNGTTEVLQNLLLLGTAASYLGSAALFLLIGTQLGNGDGCAGGGDEPLLTTTAKDDQVSMYRADDLANPPGDQEV